MTGLSGWGYAGACGASLAAGLVNSLAGGGTLISFPALVGLGLPAVTANVTNTVSLLPGYLAGSWAQRAELRPQLGAARLLTGAGALGGIAGAVLLVTLPGRAFRLAVPYLIVAACVLLLGQDRLRNRLRTRQAEVPNRHRSLLVAAVLVAAVYGGFFGAGLGIVLLAVLGIFSTRPLAGVNAVKQALSFVINLVAAVFFLGTGHVYWPVVPVMAAGSLAGGFAGGRLVGLIPERGLRALVVVAGLVVAAAFWAG